MKISAITKTRTNKNGTRTVYLRLRHGKKTVLVSTMIEARYDVVGREFDRREPGARAKTAALCRKIMLFEEIAIGNETKTADEIVEMYREACGEVQKVPETMTLAQRIREFGAMELKASTTQLYEYAARRVEMFDPKATLDSVDEVWMRRFEKFYLQTMTINGLGISLRCIRAAYNYYLKKKVTTNYPFWFFKIRAEKTRKRALTVEQLRTLRDYPCEAWQEEYRDMFMLMFYLIGINVSDLMMLRRLQDGRCVYHRNKTGKLYDIGVHPKAREIIEKYRGKNHLLCASDRYASYSNYNKRMNDALKKIGPMRIVPDKVGKMRAVERFPLFPELSGYWARHTWATIAASLDIPKETIGKALGHADAMTADIYIDFDIRKIDEANKRVIDYVSEM